jgi:hypothetical protein
MIATTRENADKARIVMISGKFHESTKIISALLK